MLKPLIILLTVGPGPMIVPEIPKFMSCSCRFVNRARYDLTCLSTRAPLPFEEGLSQVSVMRVTSSGNEPWPESQKVRLECKWPTDTGGDVNFDPIE